MPDAKPIDNRFAEVTHRHLKRTFWMVLGVACKGAIAVHIAFGAVWAGLGLWEMVVINAGSVVLYVVALSLLRHRHNGIAAWLVGMEIVAHAVLASRILGLDSGFDDYLLVMVPLIVVGPERSNSTKVALGTALLAIYVVLDLTMHSVAPLYAAPQSVLDAVRVFNITATFLLLGCLAQVYFAAVQNAEARLRTIASTDPLTGALNRRSLLDIADRLIAEGTSLSIVIADVDHFKTVNDVHGHECGDRVLIEIHRALQDAVRPDDEVARWGGEEFVTLLPQTLATEAATIAQRACRSVAALEFVMNGAVPAILRTTMTFGVATLLPEETAQSCVARADVALYRGKAAGRNCVMSAA